MIRPRFVNIDQPILTQPQFCAGSGVPTTLANNLAQRNIFLADKVMGGRVRLWSILSTWEGRILSEAVERHKKPLADAAEIAEVARRLAEKGGVAHHWARSLEASQPLIPAFLIMAWSGNCYDAQVIRGDKSGWPDFSAVKSMETRFLPHPFLIVPLSTLFEDVWRKCTAMLTEDDRGQDAS